MARVQGGAGDIQARVSRLPLTQLADVDHAGEYLLLAMDKFTDMEREKMVLLMLSGKRPGDESFKFSALPTDIVRNIIYPSMRLPEGVRELYRGFGELCAAPVGGGAFPAISIQETEEKLRKFHEKMDRMMTWADVNRSCFYGEWFVPMYTVLMGHYVKSNKSPVIPELMGVEKVLSLVLDFGESEQWGRDNVLEACRRGHRLRKGMLTFTYSSVIGVNAMLGLGGVKRNPTMRWRGLFLTSRQVFFGERGSAERPVLVFDV